VEKRVLDEVTYWEERGDETDRLVPGEVTQACVDTALRKTDNRVKEETFMATGRDFKGNNANESKQSVLQHSLVALERRSDGHIVQTSKWWRDFRGENDDVKTTRRRPNKQTRTCWGDVDNVSF